MKLPKQKIERLAIADLQICDAYQRTVRRPLVARIKKHFDPDVLDYPTVGVRADGGRWIVDGQQRITALREMGYTHVDCRTFASEGQQREARVFRMLNSPPWRVGINATKIFHAALTEGDQNAVAIVAIAESVGFKVPTDGFKLKTAWPNIGAIARLQQIFADNGPDHLRLVLNTVYDAWTGDESAATGYILQGVSTFYKRFGNRIDRKRLVARLATFTPTRVMAMTNPDSMRTGSPGMAISNTILGIYNKGLRRKVSEHAE